MTAPGVLIERARETTGVADGAVVARTDVGREEVSNAAGDAERTEAGAAEADERTDGVERVDDVAGGLVVAVDCGVGAADVVER